ncbi:MAG: peptide deformylase [Oscillospiraceae bacterium]|jgi:peptide deformylase|nr:peptide deformylase [Oscillospiraceae bacterium]
MALRNILRDGDPTLRKRSRAVTDFNPRLHQLIDDMRETLLAAGGVGLAAPQVGVLRAVALILDTEREAESDAGRIVELINPEIAAQSGEQSGPEGCLSVPELYGIVKRPDIVKVRAFDRDGNTFEFIGKNLTARAICHEVDHLRGIMFTDLAERYLSEEELEEMSRERESGGDDTEAGEGDTVEKDV